MKNFAYQATEEDVENVLRKHSLAVANSLGKSFESMANEVFGSLDLDLIEKAALMGDDLDVQTEYANDEIARQLREAGVLEPLKAPASDKSTSAAANLPRAVVFAALGHKFELCRGPGDDAVVQTTWAYEFEDDAVRLAHLVMEAQVLASYNCGALYRDGQLVPETVQAIEATFKQLQRLVESLDDDPDEPFTSHPAVCEG